MLKRRKEESDGERKQKRKFAERSWIKKGRQRDGREEKARDEREAAGNIVSAARSDCVRFYGTRQLARKNLLCERGVKSCILPQYIRFNMRETLRPRSLRHSPASDTACRPILIGRRPINPRSEWKVLQVSRLSQSDVICNQAVLNHFILCKFLCRRQLC